MLHSLSYSSLIPPNLFILLALLGVILAWRWRRIGLVLATTAVACLYLASLPVTSVLLIRAADEIAAAVPGLPLPAPPGAIIVLAGGYQHGNRRGGPDVVDTTTLQRLASAVDEQHRTGLPILVSGGWLDGADNSLAGMMAQSLETDFGVRARWREDRSRTTYENALYSAEILRRADVSSALVVTNAWHMARSLWSFFAAGYPVVAAPIGDGQRLALTPFSFFPQAAALARSNAAMHELIGLVWYELRYRPAKQPQLWRR